jgi:hypothetical protein
MTTKTAGKTPKGQPDIGPAQPDLQAAYQVHTLAQMLYGQLATTHPWIQPTWPTPGVDPLAMQPPTTWHQPYWTQGFYGGYGFDPMSRFGPMGQPFMGPAPFFGSDVFPR